MELLGLAWRLDTIARQLGMTVVEMTVMTGSGSAA